MTGVCLQASNSYSFSHAAISFMCFLLTFSTFHYNFRIMNRISSTAVNFSPLCAHTAFVVAVKVRVGCERSFHCTLSIQHHRDVISCSLIGLFVYWQGCRFRAQLEWHCRSYYRGKCLVIGTVLKFQVDISTRNFKENHFCGL